MKDFTEEKILGLAYTTIPHDVRDRLDRGGIRYTKDLIAADDEKLQRCGLGKTHITALDRLLKKHGLKREASGDRQKAQLRILTEKSKIGVGTFADHTVEQLIEAQKFRILRRLYYTVANIDFTPEIKNRINLTITIPKPGTDPKAMEECNEENERNISGRTKLKTAAHISHDMREEAKQARIREARNFTKKKMEAVNHGHIRMNDTEEQEKQPDTRLFAGTIIRHGLNGINTKTPSWKEKAKDFYKQLEESVPPLFIAEGQSYIAWHRFLDHIRRNWPKEERLILSVIPEPEYSTPEYFKTLDSLKLSYTEIQEILSGRDCRLRDTFVIDPSSGKTLFLHGITLETTVSPSEPVLSLRIFEEETYERTDILQRLRAAAEEATPTTEEYAARMQAESVIISTNNIERMLLNAISVAGGNLQTVQKKEGKGRRPAAFDLRVKDGTLLIRKHSETSPHPKAFTRFETWARDNRNFLSTIHERIQMTQMTETD